MLSLCAPFIPVSTYRERSCRCIPRSGSRYECGLGACVPCQRGLFHCSDNLAVKECAKATKCDSNNDCGNWHDEPVGCQFNPSFQITLKREFRRLFESLDTIIQSLFKMILTTLVHLLVRSHRSMVYLLHTFFALFSLFAHHVR